jgi:hypothetical protein
MKIPNRAFVVLFVVFAAVLLVDALLGYLDMAQYITVRGLKVAVGFVLVALAISYLQKAKE